MANTDKYIEVLKNGNNNLFIIKKLDPDSQDPTDYINYDTEPESRAALSNIFDYVTNQSQIITTNASLPQKNGFFLIKGDCDVTMPDGFNGLRISIRVFSGTTINIIPFSGDQIEESTSTVILTAGDKKNYVFITNSWYEF